MRIPIENKGDSPLFVGGKMIPAGEMMTFEEEDLPPEHRPGATVAEEQVPANPLAAILELSIAKAAKGLPDLADDELKALEALELAGKNRKGMLAEISMEILRRAEIVAAGNLKTISDPTAEGNDAINLQTIGAPPAEGEDAAATGKNPEDSGN